MYVYVCIVKIWNGKNTGHHNLLKRDIRLFTFTVEFIRYVKFVYIIRTIFWTWHLKIKQKIRDLIQKHFLIISCFKLLIAYNEHFWFSKKLVSRHLQSSAIKIFIAAFGPFRTVNLFYLKYFAIKTCKFGKCIFYVKAKVRFNGIVANFATIEEELSRSLLKSAYNFDSHGNSNGGHSTVWTNESLKIGVKSDCFGIRSLSSLSKGIRSKEEKSNGEWEDW